MPKRAKRESLLTRMECEGECIVWKGNHTPALYGQAMFGGRIMYMHRVSWMVHNERDVPDGAVVRHRCDNPPCLNPEHLDIGTQLDNVYDMFRRKRSALSMPGTILDDSTKARITDEHRSAYKSLSTKKRRGYARILAVKFGVSERYIMDLLNGSYIRNRKLKPKIA